MPAQQRQFITQRTVGGSRGLHWKPVWGFPQSHSRRRELSLWRIQWWHFFLFQLCLYFLSQWRQAVRTLRHRAKFEHQKKKKQRKSKTSNITALHFCSDSGNFEFSTKQFREVQFSIARAKFWLPTVYLILLIYGLKLKNREIGRKISN